jgi:murein peptide amidase A
MRPLGALTIVATLSLIGVGACGGGAKGNRPSSAAPPEREPAAASRQAARTPVGHVRVVAIGRSVRGRQILARVIGDPAASRHILVVGCVHGNETAGEAITRRLRSAVPPAGSVLWLVDEFNPDGCQTNMRQNAHGVDLNRNSPWHWQRLERPGGTYYSGPGPLSEPESRAINRLVRRLRPAVSIWYHQHASLVDDSSGGSVAIESRYARAVGLPLRNYGVFPGSIATWQDVTYPHDTAFVVELPAGPLPRSSLTRHVAAILALG